MNAKLLYVLLALSTILFSPSTDQKADSVVITGKTALEKTEVFLMKLGYIENNQIKNQDSIRSFNGNYISKTNMDTFIKTFSLSLSHASHDSDHVCEKEKLLIKCSSGETFTGL